MIKPSLSILQAVLAVAIAFSFGTKCLAEESAPAQWRLDLQKLLNERRLDEATALIHERARERPPPPEFPKGMYSLAQALLLNSKRYEAYPILQEITQRYPDNEAAGLAWCSLGRLYGDPSIAWQHLGRESLGLRLEERKIEAYERGFSLVNKHNEQRPYTGDTDYRIACNELGKHYIALGEWERAKLAYTAWRTDSSCGTCYASMNAERHQALLLCELQLGRHEAAIEQIWRKLVHPDLDSDAVGPYVLIRLYTEAEQLDDLARLKLELIKSGFERFPVEDPKAQRHLGILISASQSVSPMSASRWAWAGLSESLRDPRSGQPANTTVSHIARWTLIREGKEYLPHIQREARAGNPQFIELLIAMDSQESQDALVQLALSGDENLLQQICRLINSRARNPQELIDRITANLPEKQRVLARGRDTPPELVLRLYKPWPLPDPGSLPKTLPDNLLEEMLSAN